MCQELLTGSDNREHLSVCSSLRNNHRRNVTYSTCFMQSIPQWVKSSNWTDVYELVSFNANSFSLTLQQVLEMPVFTRKEKLLWDLSCICESSPSLPQRMGSEETVQVVGVLKKKILLTNLYAHPPPKIPKGRARFK